MQEDDIGRQNRLRQIVHILISLQILGWAFSLVAAGLGPNDMITLEETRGYLFLGFMSMILCFIPALRMARTYEKQPLAFILALMPLVVLIGVLLANLTQRGAINV